MGEGISPKEEEMEQIVIGEQVGGVWNGMIKCAGRRKRDMKKGIWRNTAKIEDHLRGCIKA